MDISKSLRSKFTLEAELGPGGSGAGRESGVLGPLQGLKRLSQVGSGMGDWFSFSKKKVIWGDESAECPSHAIAPELWGKNTRVKRGCGADHNL